MTTHIPTHCLRQESVNWPFLLTLLWLETPFATAGQETCSNTNSTANIFVILLRIYITFVNCNSSVTKCTLFSRWVQRTTSESSRFFFEHTASDQHVVLAHTTQHNKLTHLAPRVIAMVQENRAMSSLRDYGHFESHLLDSSITITYFPQPLPSVAPN
jgi:hypothetical protein